jgi:hypothetical protein
MPVAPAVALKRIAAANNDVFRMSSLPVRLRPVNTGTLANHPGARFLPYRPKTAEFPADCRRGLQECHVGERFPLLYFSVRSARGV